MSILKQIAVLRSQIHLSIDIHLTCQEQKDSWERSRNFLLHMEAIIMISNFWINLLVTLLDLLSEYLSASTPFSYTTPSPS